MDKFETDTVIIGAGVIGLACGVEMARRGHEVIVLEAASIIGSGTSSRNSEVVHAGIYYQNGSLKHTGCVRGRRALYQYLDQRGVTYAKCGKLIVATTLSEDEKIFQLYQQGLDNDVEGLEVLTSACAQVLEPELFCTSALMSHQTGIFDSHGYMLALLGELEDFGGVVAFESPVAEIVVVEAHCYHVITGGRHPTQLSCRRLINAAGLHAHKIARTTHGYDLRHLPPFQLAKGSYFTFNGRPAFKRLIYPAPVNGGLGVHVTLDLQGQMRFGPDVEWLEDCIPDNVDYAVQAHRAESFYDAVRTYWPNLPDNSIMPDYAGCRPKITLKDHAAGDFIIQSSGQHKCGGLVHLFGIESPGLTASLEIAHLVGEALSRDDEV